MGLERGPVGNLQDLQLGALSFVFPRRECDVVKGVIQHGEGFGSDKNLSGLVSPEKREATFTLSLMTLHSILSGEPNLPRKTPTILTPIPISMRNPYFRVLCSFRTGSRFMIWTEASLALRAGFPRRIKLPKTATIASPISGARELWC